MDSGARKVELGWQLCKVADYVKDADAANTATKLRYARVRKCVHAAWENKLQECTAPEGELKCVNCMTQQAQPKQ